MYTYTCACVRACACVCERERGGRERDLILVNVEAAELLLLPFSGDGERTRDELADQSSHHSFKTSVKSATEIQRDRRENLDHQLSKP
jgi:hypothetical protein